MSGPAYLQGVPYGRPVAQSGEWRTEMTPEQAAKWQADAIAANQANLNYSLSVSRSRPVALPPGEGGSGDSTLFYLGAAGVGLLAIGGIVYAIRRRRKNSAGTTIAAIAGATPAVMSAAAAIAGPIAMAVSYSRNGSLLWAFGAGFVGVPYLVYAALTPKKRAEVARKNRTRRYRRSR